MSVASDKKAEAIAVFSDVHSNLEALEAVLADIRQCGINRLFCLGDIVGYAADPAACLALVRESGARIIQGNHDEAVASDCGFEGVSETAAAGFLFSRKALDPEQRRFLASLPLQRRSAGCQFVHASLDDPAGWHYIDCDEEAVRHFEVQTAPVAFCGHTHVPLIACRSDDGVGAMQGAGIIEIPAGLPVLVNVGSVGQPRDGNPDACYVIYRPAAQTVEFRRVSYDVAATMRKIRAAGLPAFTARRLKSGR